MVRHYLFVIDLSFSAVYGTKIHKMRRDEQYSDCRTTLYFLLGSNTRLSLSKSFNARLNVLALLYVSRYLSNSKTR